MHEELSEKLFRAKDSGETANYERIEDKYKLLRSSEVKERIKKTFLGALYGGNVENLTMEQLSHDLSAHGKITLDSNGLRAFNEYTSHQTGDVYLDRLAFTLSNSAKIKEFANQHGLEYQIAREGGDEFSFLVRREGGSLRDEAEKDANILTAFREVIVSEVNSIDMGDLLDFRDEKTRGNLDEEGKRLLKEAGEDYKFKASIAGGEFIFDKAIQILFEKVKKGEIKETSLDLQDEAGDKLMGVVQNSAEEAMKANKEFFKKSLEDGGPEKLFTLYLLSRTDEAKKLINKIREQKEAIRKLTGEKEEISKEYDEKGKQLEALKEMLHDLLSISKQADKKNER